VAEAGLPGGGEAVDPDPQPPAPEQQHAIQHVLEDRFSRR
jgi:hypothetical protein